MARADSTARASWCVRTRLKSWPKRDSIAARGVRSSGSPEERSTSCTIGGMVLVFSTPAGLRCRRFLEHSSQSPLNPGAPPQAHLRCNRLLRASIRTSGIATRVWLCGLTVSRTILLP